MAERFKIVLGVINIILKDNKVLLLLRKNKFDGGTYSLPGGCMEPDETPLQNSIKEIKEETNLDVKIKNVEVVSSIYRHLPTWQALELVVLVKKFSGEPKNMEPDKSEKLEWFDLDKLPKKISGYALKGIQNYLNKERHSDIKY